jgi:Flp pilus assembly secretin CpaC
MMPLDFKPGTVAVGNPDVLGMEVRYVDQSYQLHLLGQSVGSTNLVVFDAQNTPRVSVDVTVGPPIGNADRIAVYKGTDNSTVYCSLGKCASLDAQK